MSKMKKKILITGGQGFIGHHVVEGILKDTDWEIVILDRLDTSGNPNRLADISIWEKEKRRVTLVWWDLKSVLNDFVIKKIGKVDYILHLAAATHVDRSIEYPMEFVMDNVVATANLLDYCRENPCKKFVYFSTDEVYGPAPRGVAYKEGDRHYPTNPYSATKSGAESLCRAYSNTYKMPIIITNTMNVFGERQHPEKYIPLVINKVLEDEVVTVHSNPAKTKLGSRFYIHARNVAKAILFILEKGKPFGDGEAARMGTYHIVGEKEVDNLELAKFIAKVIGKTLKYELVDFHSSRPGHDLRYGMSGEKLYDLGFRFPKTFEESLEKTIRWYLRHPEWR